MNAAGVGAISASIAIPIGFRLLRRLFPSTTSASTTLSFAELKAKYQKWTNIMAAVMVIVTAPLFIVFWIILKALANWCASLLPPADVTFAPIVPAYWLFPAFMLALTCSGFAAMAVVQWLLGRRYEEFLGYWSRSSGMSPIKANKVVLEICTGLCAILVFLGLRPYVQLTRDDLVVKGYFSFVETRYPIAEIQNIRTSAHFIARNGNTVSRREYIVTFAGNRRWTTAYIPSDPNEATKRTFAEMLASRSHVPIEQVALFPKGEL